MILAGRVAACTAYPGNYQHSCQDRLLAALQDHDDAFQHRSPSSNGTDAAGWAPRRGGVPALRPSPAPRAGDGPPNAYRDYHEVGAGSRGIATREARAGALQPPYPAPVYYLPLAPARSPTLPRIISRSSLSLSLHLSTSPPSPYPRARRPTGPCVPRGDGTSRPRHWALCRPRHGTDTAAPPAAPGSRG